MLIRTLGGGAMLVILFGIIFFAPPWALPLAIGIMSAIGVHELLSATGFIHNNKRMIVYGMVFALLVPIWVYFGTGNWGVVLGILMYTLLLFMEGLAGSKEVTFDKICITFFAGIAIPYMLSSIIRIIALADDPKFVGRLLLLYPLVDLPDQIVNLTLHRADLY